MLILLMLFGCAARSEEYETEFFAMDTGMGLHIYGADDPAQLASEVIQRINGLEQLLSVTKEQSEVAQLNSGYTLSPSSDLQRLLEATLRLSDRTGGCLDPTIYPIVKLWGFTTGSYRVPSKEEIAQALSLTGTDRISQTNGCVSLSPGTQLDFGAVAKGYSAQACAELISQAGANAIVNLGGNIQTVGQKSDGSPWRIGITDPENPSDTIAVLTLQGSHAVVTSGGYQRYFEEDGVRYSHIMDPATGESARSGLCSVTIVADNGFLADGLSTALYVMGPERATEFWRTSDDFETVLITDTGEIFVSEGLSSVFSCGKEFQVIER